MKKQIGAFSIFALFAGVSTSALAQEQTPASALPATKPTLSAETSS